MGINTNYSIYGMKDYAAEFKQFADESSKRNAQMLRDAGITVPIGQPSQKDEQKGLAVEHAQPAIDLGNLELKENRKAAVEKVKEAFLKNGTADGRKITDEKEAERMAEAYVKNEANRQKSARTNVYMDKDAYKSAQKEREQQYNDLVQKYRDQGLTRFRARKRAKAELDKNEYVKNKQTRAFVENHEEMFYDEDGNFSSDKFKQKAVEWANAHTKNDEVENYHLSLKERREAASKEGTTPKVVKNVADKSNIGYEKDLTPLYRTAAVVGGAVGGYFAGSALLGASASATAVAGGSAAAGTSAAAGASAVATAEASVNGGAIGLPLGAALGAGVAPLIKDRGGKEARIYEPAGEQEPVKQEVTSEACVLTPGQKVNLFVGVEDIRQQVEYCPYEVKKDDLWSGIVAAKYRHEDGTPLTQKEMKEVWTGLKKMHNIPLDLTYIPVKELKLYSEINGKKYCVDCDAEVKQKNQGNYIKPTKLWDGKEAEVPTRTVRKLTIDTKTQYYYSDCSGNQSEMFNTPEKRNVAMKAEQDRINELNK